MRLNNFISIFFLFLFLAGFSTELDAQRTGSRKRTTETKDQSRSSRDKDAETETIPLSDRIIYDIHIGQLGFNQGFQISTKVGAAYKFNDILSLGLGFKTFYYAINNPGTLNDGSIFDYGPYLYPRVKVSQNVYIKGEYYYLSKDIDFSNTGNAERQNKFIPLIGAGYVSGYGPWKFGLELLYIATDNATHDNFFYGDWFEYMFSFNYNF